MRLTVTRIAVIFARNMNEIITTAAKLEELALRDIKSGERKIWAIVGCAGSGKTTLTTRLESTLAKHYAPGMAKRVGMGGFHLANHILEERGAIKRKGDIDTFDAYGMLSMLQRFPIEADHSLYFPLYDRTIAHQAVAGAIEVTPDCRLLLVEGLWLLAPDPGWREMRPLFQRSFHIYLNEDTRLERLRGRHLTTDNYHSPELIDEHLAFDAARDPDVLDSMRKADYLVVLEDDGEAKAALSFD